MATPFELHDNFQNENEIAAENGITGDEAYAVPSPRVPLDAPRTLSSNEVIVIPDEWQNCVVEGTVWNRTDVDGLVCSICMDVWTNNGEHHICCLPCGHIYGMSCIKTWLQHGENSGKCPQCNTKCSVNDVRKLYASRVVAVDEESHMRIRLLEAKCAALERKDNDWHKKEAGWKKKEADLHLQVQKLKEDIGGGRSERQVNVIAELFASVRRDMFTLTQESQSPSSSSGTIEERVARMEEKVTTINRMAEACCTLLQMRVLSRRR